MDSILEMVPFGEDLGGDTVKPRQVVGVLEGLEDALADRGLRWNEVSLLVLADSTEAESDRHQHECSNAVTTGIAQFCAEREWYPPLIGTSVLGSFFRQGEREEAEIKAGIQFIACCSAVFPKIPVAVEVTHDKAERRFAGERVLGEGIRAFRARHKDHLGFDVPPLTVAESSVGLIFTTGSGHIESKEFIDFKECYAVGQELLRAASESEVQLFGGCATNRTEQQLQCIYYSEEIGAVTHYQSTFRHGAVLTFLPYTRAQPHLRHPYRPLKTGKLDIKWHPRDAYGDGLNFYVREINGQSPIEFLAGYWDYSVADLETMAAKHTAIPSKPKAHLVTIASSLNRHDENTWPNVAIWLDLEGTEILLRLVRAEAEDGNFYLMEMKPEFLADNARDLMTSVTTNFNEQASVISFLCESRKYVLDGIDSNAEATTMLSKAPGDGAVIGIYLNGEYSTGSPKSIGYHNYSQISAIFPARPKANLPADVLDAITRRAAEEMEPVRLFMCHEKSDSPTVRLFADLIEEELPGSVSWIDEDELITGDYLRERIREAIESENEFFVPFLSDRSVHSEWVRTEMSWALKQERKADQTLVLPVILGDRAAVIDSLRECWSQKKVDQLDARLQLHVHDYTKEEMEAKARRLATHVRKRMKRRAQNENARMATLDPMPGS
jgi:hypothetical protein